jgi:hypothetical protein
MQHNETIKALALKVLRESIRTAIADKGRPIYGTSTDASGTGQLMGQLMGQENKWLQ